MNWLLLRGLAREQRHWGTFPAALTARLDGGRVYCLDLPGMGSEHARAGSPTMSGIVADVRRRWLRVAARISGPCGLAGVSLGGMAAMQWAGDHPSDFSSVVLMNTSAGDLSPPWHRMFPKTAVELARSLVDRDPLVRERRILAATTRMQGDIESIAAEWVTIGRERRPTPGAVLLQLLAATRFRAPRMLTPPVLILVGAGDRLTNPECGSRLQRHFDARLEIHPRAGHDLTLDDPAWVIDRIASFPESVRA